jgi:hypothetical protein
MDDVLVEGVGTGEHIGPGGRVRGKANYAIIGKGERPIIAIAIKPRFKPPWTNMIPLRSVTECSAEPPNGISIHYASSGILRLSGSATTQMRSRILDLLQAGDTGL